MKQHFEILDGLRGIAALGVVVFHFMEWVFSDYSKNFIGHGFLAVDFFFCLSGFVIGYAYDNRIGQMGVWEFFKSRIIRLHPLVKLGFPGLAILLSLALVMPFLKLNWLIESIVVLFYFPLLVALGAGATLSPGLKKICTFSGQISYPLYMTHYAGIWIFANYIIAHKPASGELFIMILSGTIFLVGFAWLVMKVYDIPVRKYLTNKRRQ